MFTKDFCDYVQSGHAMLSVNTHEKDRAIQCMIIAAKEIKKHIYVWSIVSNWRDQEGAEASKEPADPQSAIQAIFSMDENAIFVLKDFGAYVSKDTYNEFDVVIGWLGEIRQVLSNTGRTIVFLGPEFKVPIQLKHDVTDISFDLPDEQQIEEAVKFVCSGVTKKDGGEFKVDEQIMPGVVRACRGMTQNQVLDRASLAIRKTSALGEEAITVLLHEKAGVIKSTGILRYSEPPEGGLSVVGGLECLKQHIALDKPCFGDEAKKFGIESPKGILLVGIPGCGKTLVAMSIASEFGFPLVSLDVGDLMSKWVGESESNMSEAIRLLEGISPCVLLVDEIEKGFGGAGGDNDGGASSRVFGKFIKWMNDKRSLVYVIATANNVQSLPPEFARKGRFDEIFGVDLPTKTEREEILKIHITKRGRSIQKFDLAELSLITDGYTGADIEACVRLSLKMAFRDKMELTNKHLEESIKNVVPLIKTEPQRIEAIRSWCKTHSKAANSQEKTATQKPVRKVNISPN